MDFGLTFYQLIIDELICIRLKPEIAAKWTIQGKDYENDGGRSQTSEVARAFACDAIPISYAS